MTNSKPNIRELRLYREQLKKILILGIEELYSHDFKNIDDEVRDLIARDGSSMEIRAKALELGYKPLVIDGLKKVLNGITTLDEINNKLIIY